MRRLFFVALAVMFLAASVLPAMAVEVKFSGELRVRGEVYDEAGTNARIVGRKVEINNAVYDYQDELRRGQLGLGVYPFNPGWNTAYSVSTPYKDGKYDDDVDDTASYWDARLRLQMEFVASDDLKGVYQLEVGDVTFGGDTSKGGEPGEAVLNDNSGRLSADEVNVETKSLYLDFNVPNTPVNAKVGIMPAKLGHGIVLNDDVAGILLTGRVEPVAVGVFTYKFEEGDTTIDDDTDLYGLYLNTDLQDIGTIGLFGVYGRYQSDTNPRWGSLLDITESDGDAIDYNGSEAWWLGLCADIAVDPLVVAFEADYYNETFDATEQFTDAGGEDFDADGWLLYLDIGANLDVAKVGIAGLYATGIDDDDLDDEDGDFRYSAEAFLPISPTDPEDACVLDWDNLYVLDIQRNILTNLMSLKGYVEAEPMDNLVVGLSVQGYWKEEDPTDSGKGLDDYIGTEVDLDVEYKIYENLSYQIQAAYMFTDDDVWGNEEEDVEAVYGDILDGDINAEDIWFLSHKLVYTF